MISMLEVLKEQQNKEQNKRMGGAAAGGAALGGLAGAGGVMSTDTYKTGKTLKKGAKKAEEKADELKDKAEGFFSKFKDTADEAS